MRQRLSSPMPRWLMLSLLSAVLLTASGCLHSGWLDRFFGGKLRMQVSISQDLNARSPVAVELIVAYDKGVLAMLESMTAEQWFAQRQQLLQRFTQQQDLMDAWAWEWVPGQVVPEQVRRYRIGARGGGIFANYSSPGDHRASLSPFHPLLLSLGAGSFEVVPLGSRHGSASASAAASADGGGN